MKKTKMVCTLGPSSDSSVVLKEMIAGGMNVARLNMAHGDLPEHRERIRMVREAAMEMNAFVPVMMDIKGPEIRIGQLEEPGYWMESGQQLILTTEPCIGNSSKVSISYLELPQAVKAGSKILIDDGMLELVVEKVEASEVYCRVQNSAALKPRKGVNLPGTRTNLPGVTEKDIKHIQFGLEAEIDMIAVSFVRRAEDILQIRQILQDHGADHIQIVSKIENEEGIENLDAIIKVSDGIMVARGDLGVEIPSEEVPLVQKLIIEKCNHSGKPVIVATQMLDSMQVNPRPTRAEASDVANAVLEGADAIMLSGETAAGKYAAEAVRMMAVIAERAESTIDYHEQLRKRGKSVSVTITEAISQAVVRAAGQLEAAAIVTPTESGFTPRMVSKYRPKAPIIAISENKHTLTNVSLLWGVLPLRGEPTATTDDLIKSALYNAKRSDLAKSGDYVVISAGIPIGKSGATNLIRIERVD